MATIYQSLLDYSTSLPNSRQVYDFSNWDAVNTEYPAFIGGSGTGSAKFYGNDGEVLEKGFLTDGIENRLVGQINLATSTQPRTAVFLFKLPEISAGCIFDVGKGASSDNGMFTVSLNLDGTLTIISNGGSDSFTTQNTISAGVTSIIAISLASSSSFIVYGDINNPTTETFTSGYTSDTYLVTYFGRLRAGGGTYLAVEGYYWHLATAALNQADIQGFINAFSIYGELTLSSSLDSSRFQSVVALKPSREVDDSTSVAIGSSDILVQLFTKKGELVEFFAFDTDEEKSVLTTGPVVPDTLEPLVFNPVSGGGDSGTGLLAHIAGTVAIDGTAAEREVIVISDDSNGRQVLGQGMSANDGTFDIEYSDWGGAVIALALDNYGGEWAAETVIASGTVIHPTTPNGYVYEATSGGTTGTSEPTWSTSSVVNDGSVTWNSRPFYRPVASGPIKGEVLEEGTPTEPDATPYRFFRIIITDNNNGGTGYTAISEIELRVEESGTDLTTPSTIITSTSVYPANNNYPVTAMFDNDLETVWLSEIEVLPITITLDMGSEVGISHLVMTRGGADVQSNLDQAPKDFTVEASNDATTWIELNNFVGITGWVANEPRTFPIAVT